MLVDEEVAVFVRPVRVKPSVVLRLLLITHAVIFVLYICGRWAFFSLELGPVSGHLARLTDMGGEPTFPTWISLVQLLTATALLVFVAMRVRAHGARWWRHWLLLSAVFAYISLDEQSEIHESLVYPLQALLGITTGPFLLAWVIPALILLALLTVVYVPFLRALPKATFLRFLLAAVIFVGGAAGMEMVDAVTYERLRDLGEAGAAVKSVLYGVEELLEMVGVAVFIYALLMHIRDFVPKATAFELSR